MMVFSDAYLFPFLRVGSDDDIFTINDQYVRGGQEALARLMFHLKDYFSSLLKIEGVRFYASP